MLASDLLITRFGGGAIAAGLRTVLLFDDGESSVTNSLFYRNGGSGRRQLRGGLDGGVEFLDLHDPKLRDVRFFANPDARLPRPAAAGPPTDPPDAGHVELQRQIDELRNDLLAERERRVDRQLEANGAVLFVLGVVIGVGGFRFHARLRAIAAEARIGAAPARGYVPAPHGLLPRQSRERFLRSC